ELAAIRNVAFGRNESGDDLAVRAAAISAKTYTGWEQFAGFTVALGSHSDERHDERVSGLGTWDPYHLHGLFTALLAALLALPAFVLCTWRGMGRVATGGATLLAVLSPVVFVNVGVGR